MVEEIKTMEEFLDKAAIDTGSQTLHGTISVIAELKESRLGRVYDLTWTYKGNEDYTFGIPQVSFDPEDNEKIGDYLNDRIVEAELQLKQRGINPLVKGYQITLRRQKVHTGTAAEIINSVGSVASESEFVSIGKEVDIGDIYAIGARKGLSPEDVLLRIKTYNEKQVE